jgi:mRNA interferase MazF
MTTPTTNPKRGEVWRVELEPVRGSEQGKTRPVVVLSEPPIGRATMRLCAPVMQWKPEHPGYFWCITLPPDADNGLSKQSTADAAQTRALDTVRFVEKIGAISETKLELLAQALCRCVKRPPTQPTPSAAPKS